VVISAFCGEAMAAITVSLQRLYRTGTEAGALTVAGQ
jgi:hypothetical protein